MSIRKKMLVTFFTSVCGLLILLALILQYEVHRHFRMVVCPPMNSVSHSLTRQIQSHFEQALTQSLLWTLLIFVVVTAVMAVLISRAMTRRILAMQRQAERIAQGDWSATFPENGRDELSSLANTLNYLAEQLENQEKLRKNLMQDIAHELRTPLTTLRSQIQAFYDGIWTVHSSVRTSRAELSFQEERNPVWVTADPNYVTQITWNLLDNAVKFTRKGGCIAITGISRWNHQYRPCPRQTTRTVQSTAV